MILGPCNAQVWARPMMEAHSFATGALMTITSNVYHLHVYKHFNRDQLACGLQRISAHVIQSRSVR